jgi:hypothetical protein
MSTKKVIASYAVELTENESGSLSITATQREPFEGFSAPPATATSLGILETIQTLLLELLNISRSHQQ